ncbi:MAG TPA: tyrosine--tRNA ligase [Candidatus Bathyarchaeia archaeon]|nr:MAG: tyrosine--tRNA ligase [Candidatus Bathyarchaeota archaeon RBG_16_48_13]HJX23719.1 tyrosine--tRNA ligase [Candidatus Bathyarchaeia archaeon]
MDFSEKLSLITKNATEVVTLIDLKKLLQEKKPLRGYIGVEPSGFFHVGWMIWASKLKELIEADIEMVFLQATWHAWINDKLGGDMKAIQKCGDYIIHCIRALGINVNRFKVITADDLVEDPDYWALVLKVAKSSSLLRMKRTMTILGRKGKEGTMDFSKLVYPCMQVADIFYLNLDICLGGTDQRKAHMLARDAAEKLGKKRVIAIHTPLMSSLTGAGRMDISKSETELMEIKMSKSKPETAIFIHDSEEVIEKKISAAYCPPRIVEGNPVIDLNRYLFFTDSSFSLPIDRPRKYGGDISIESIERLTSFYSEGKLHPLDLKNSTIKVLNERLKPVRRYFAENEEARNLYDFLNKRSITR